MSKFLSLLRRIVKGTVGIRKSNTTVFHSRHVKDSTAAAGVTILFFLLPSKLDFLRSFDTNPANRPTKPSTSMITWKMIHQKMHWSLIFVLGGGFAISAGSTNSKLSSILGNALTALQLIDPFTILLIVCLFAETVTELTSNVAVANIILPVLAEMVRNSQKFGKTQFSSFHENGYVCIYHFSASLCEYILCI